VFGILWECPFRSDFTIFESGFHCFEYGNLELFGSAYFRHPFGDAVDASFHLVRFWVGRAVEIVLWILALYALHGTLADCFVTFLFNGMLVCLLRANLCFLRSRVLLVMYIFSYLYSLCHCDGFKVATKGCPVDKV